MNLSGIPVLKDRVVMAIFIAEMLKGKTDDALVAFQDLLGSRSALSDEFKKYSNY